MISYGDTDTLNSLDGVLVLGGEHLLISSLNFLGTLRTFLGGDCTVDVSNSIGFSTLGSMPVSTFPRECDRRACGTAEMSSGGDKNYLKNASSIRR